MEARENRAWETRYRRQESKGKGMRVLKGLKAGEIGGNLGCLNCQQNQSNKPIA